MKLYRCTKALCLVTMIHFYRDCRIQRTSRDVPAVHLHTHLGHHPLYILTIFQVEAVNTKLLH